MINRDLVKYIRENWMKYLKYVSDISKGGKKSCSLVPASSKMSFDFDAIVEDMFSENKKTMSIDMIDFSDQWIILTEFKGGFHDKITDKTYVPQNCRYISNYLCPELRPYQKKRRESEKKELISAIVQKALESYILLHVFVMPKCNNLGSGVYQKIKLVVVFDGDPIDNAISTAEEYCRGNSICENKERIMQALKRFINDKSMGVEDFYYDDIKVYDALEYETRFLKS